MEFIMNQRYRLRNSQENIPKINISKIKEGVVSKTSNDIQMIKVIIQGILKQCRTKVNERDKVKELGDRIKLFGQKKSSHSPIFRDQSPLSILSQMKLTSRTPCSLKSPVQIKQPNSTKSGCVEQKRAYFFQNKKDNVFDESQQITVKTLERDSSTNEPEPSPQWYMNCKGRVRQRLNNDSHSDYMLGTLNNDLYHKIKHQYFKKQIAMPLNDPLINESDMKIAAEEYSNNQNIKLAISPRNDEATTLSKSGSRDFHSSEKDKTQQFKDQFMVGKQIGSVGIVIQYIFEKGSYASVRHCVDRKSLKAFALKIYTKNSLSASRKRSILREIRLLQFVKHCNVVKIFDAVETNNHVNLTLELIQGKALSTTFKNSPFTITEIKGILYQVGQALSYLHRLNVTHRDVKLENVLYVAESKDVKLIDFGFSTLMKQNRKMFCGTPSYMAPEIVRRSVYKGQPVDIWALGVMLFALVSQQFPFKGCNDKDLYQKISFGQYNLSLIINNEIKDLVTRMLCTDPDHRITADEVALHSIQFYKILQHSFFDQPLLPNFGLLINKVKKAKSKEQQPSTVKTFKYVPEKDKRKGPFVSIYDSRQPIIAQSCLSSPRIVDDAANITYLQSQQQSTVKKIEPPLKNFVVAPHNKTIHPSFVPSFMSSVQSLKSQDSNHYLTIKQKNSNIANQTFNDTSGILNISFNNSFMQNEKNKLFQNFINKISQC